MTHVPINLPFRGFTEQNSFSAVPDGMTPSCVNVMPRDPWAGRTRIGTRNGTRRYNIGSVQFIGTYRIYDTNGVLTERLIVVQNGIVKHGDPQADVSGTLPSLTTFAGQSVALLSSTAPRIDGVQFNQYFFFVDGNDYAFIDLTASTPTVARWGGTSGSGHGPYRTNTSGGTGNGANLICRWGARLVLSGYRKAPNLWFACEPDDPYPHIGTAGSTDGWDFQKAIGAVGGTLSEEYGTLGDPIIAIFPFGGTGLMFGCSNSMHYLTGDPVFQTGDVQVVAMSRSIGIVGPDAWCQSQEKGAWMLGRDGLYYLAPNTFNIDRSARISAGRLDSFFLRLDFGTPAVGSVGPYSGGTGGGGTTGTPPKVLNPSTGEITEPILEEDLYGSTEVLSGGGSSLLGGAGSGDIVPSMCYDPDREGVWMFLTVSGVEENSIHLFYDMKTDSFWPQRFHDEVAYGPARAVFVQGDRTKESRMFLGGADSISFIGNEFAIGIDGYSASMSDEEQRARLVRSSLTFGPIIAPLPYRVLMSEVRMDMAEDKYELPSGFNNLSVEPTLSVSTGDTAQMGLGLQTDELFVTSLNLLVVDGGVAQTPLSPTVYDGGTAAVPSPHRIDGRFAQRPFGRYTQDNPFAEGINRTYTGPSPWIIVWDNVNDVWTIDRVGPIQTEYDQVSSDPSTPDGLMESSIQIPVTPALAGNAVVSGASFPEAEVTEIGSVRSGRNVAKKCRIRAEAMYLTIASDGRPFAIERASAVVSQVGKSRGGVE